MAITASEARKKLFPLIEQVNEDHAPVEITSKRGDAVLMSVDDYRALEETAYLLRSPTNVRRLIESIDQARVGTVTEHELDR
jgi:antitoxin YefM